MVLYVYFPHIILLFVSIFGIYSIKKVNSEKKLGTKGRFKNRKANTPFATTNDMFTFIILLK